MPAVPTLVGESEIFDVDGHWDSVRNHDWPHMNATVPTRGWRYRTLLEFSYILPVVLQRLAYEFDMEPTPTGGADSEELPCFAHKGSFRLVVFSQGRLLRTSGCLLRSLSHLS